MHQNRCLIRNKLLVCLDLAIQPLCHWYVRPREQGGEGGVVVVVVVVVVIVVVVVVVVVGGGGGGGKY